MRFPPEPPPFTERKTIVGKFSAAGRVSAPLDCVLDISKINGHRITGYVLGNQSVVKDLENVQRRETYVSFEGTDGQTAYTSDRVILGSMSSFGQGTEEFPHGLIGIACYFECDNLSARFESSTPVNDETPREITFLLVGPSRYWLMGNMRGFSYTGEVTLDHVQVGRPIGRTTDPSLESRRHYLFSQDDGSKRDPYHSESESVGRRARSETSVPSLVLRTKRSGADYPDEQFLADATAIVEDACLLVSFLSRGLVTWFRYHQSSSTGFTQFVRNIGKRRDYESDDDMMQLQDVHRFFRLAFRRLRELRGQKRDLTLPADSSS
jgi:hypothetical protein